MSKPLFRWTVGNCLQQGLDILAESVRVTTKALGNNWDYVICYNGLNKDEVAFLADRVKTHSVRLFSQNWADCPISNNCQTPRRSDGSFEYNGNRCGGTLWKVCPARMRMDAHEIIMDNDILLLQQFPQIIEFLNSDKALVLEEPIRFYGRYDCLFGPESVPLNSGFLGLPPGYDFGAAICKNWEQYGRYENISQADEQGLLTYTLNQQPNIRISSRQMVEVLHRDFKTVITGREEAIHFTQANRMPNHPQWNKYQKISKAII